MLAAEVLHGGFTYPWTPKVHKIRAFESDFRDFGPLFSVPTFGVQVLMAGLITLIPISPTGVHRLP